MVRDMHANESLREGLVVYMAIYIAGCPPRKGEDQKELTGALFMRYIHDVHTRGMDA